ncbi:MAG: spore germination protein [Bacteroidetes bacterium]|nr:MAG: spore germination protein [Bacteroidota bacterium]
MNLDFITRKLQIQFGNKPISCALLYFVSASSKTEISEVIHSLMFDIDISTQTGTDLFDIIVSQCIPYAFLSVRTNRIGVANSLLSGNSILLIDGQDKAIELKTEQFKQRSVTSPQTEQVIQGPREGFTESLITNISLVRKRLRSPNFRVELIQIGKQAAINVAYCYMEGIVNENLVKEVKKRLLSVDTDTLYGSGYLEQFIEDNRFSPFPQVQNTERPDRAAANVLEGRVLIIVDGTPFVLIVPAIFSQFYQTTEDYDTRFLMASFIRMIRVVSLLFSLIFPSIYISLISFNPEMIPTKFAVAVAGGRAGVPFPAIVEIFGIELIMEILREATIRLPQQVGGALSIVGVLVIGQAAVQAGFVSPITVVIVALTTIGSFATPAYNAAIALRMLRFPIMFLAGMFGLYGVMIGLILIAVHLNSLESFGVPYLTPIVPFSKEGIKDSIFRFPSWMMKKRPEDLKTKDRTRIEDSGLDQKGRPLTPSDPDSEDQNYPSNHSLLSED